MNKKIAAAVAVLSTVLVGVASPAHLALGSPAETCVSGGGEDLQTFRLSIQSAREAYRVGEVATIEGRVERDLQGHTEPAQGVNVLVGLTIKRVQLFGAAVTDDEGIATIEIKLKRYVPTGTVHADASATKEYGDGHCLGFREVGQTEVDNFFTIRRAR
jgi:hypothetical protein